MLNVRRFTRASPSYVTFGTGQWSAGGIEALVGSGFSIAAVIRLKQVGVRQIILDVYRDSDGAQQFQLWVNSDNTLGANVPGAGDILSTFTLAVDTWYLIGFDWDQFGTDETRMHRFIYGGSWIHENRGTRTSGNADGNLFKVGGVGASSGSAGSGNLDAEVLIIGLSPIKMTDAQFELLASDGKTLANWLARMGTVWRFDQAVNTTDVLDRDTFDADETAESNTTVVSTMEPTAWMGALIGDYRGHPNHVISEANTFAGSPRR